MLICSPYIC